jgi:hypothetical protein
MARQTTNNGYLNKWVNMVDKKPVGRRGKIIKVLKHAYIVQLDNDKTKNIWAFDEGETWGVAFQKEPRQPRRTSHILR